MRATALFAFAILVAPAVAQDRPLPDQDSFLREVRRHLETDDVRQQGYAYQETRRDLTLDSRQRVVREQVRVYETYPGLPGESPWKRLVSENGTPIAPAKLEKEDRERQRHVVDYARRLERETERDRQARARAHEKDRRESDAVIEDALRVFEIRMLGREAIAGHATIVLSLSPRAAISPRTDQGKLLKRFAGKAWISEFDHELVRLEFEVIDTVSLGWGLLARIHKGTRLRFERRKVNGEVWLPAEAEYTVSGRLALFKRVRARAVSQFANYRKFVVDTDATYAPPK